MRWLTRKNRGYTPPSRFRELASRFFGLRIMLKTYDPKWDHYIRVAMTLGMIRPYYYGSKPKSRLLCDCMVLIGDYQVWVGNYPYSYGGNPETGVRPSYATIKLLKKHVDRVIYEEQEESDV